MNSDLISREVLLDAFDSFRDREKDDPVVLWLEHVISVVEAVTAVDVKHTPEYKDLYSKYLILAKAVNEQYPAMMQLLTDYKENMPRFKKEYEALLRRFQHLMQSKFIASFDEHDPKTHTYRRDISEADKIAPVREGEWKTSSLPQDGYRTYCTKCRKFVDVPPFTPYDYCPRCGAKMKLR